MKIRLQNREVNIINVYGTNKDDSDFVCRINDFMNQNDNEDFITGGDFNVVLNPCIDKENGASTRSIICRRTINSFMKKHDLIDIWRIHN